MKKIINPVSIIVIAAIIGVGSLVYAFVLYPKAKIQGTSTAKLMDLQEKVSADGTVVPAEDVALSFERGGRVTSIVGDVGTHVSTGQIIASVSSADLQAQLAGARAAFETQQLKLNDLLSQSNSGSVGSSVQVSITNAKTTFEANLSSSYVSVDGVLATYVDQLFSSPRTSPFFGVSITQNGTSYSISAPQSMITVIDNDRATVNMLLSSWATLNTTAKLSGSDQDLANAEQAGEKTIAATQTMLTDITTALDSYSAQDVASQTLYNGYKTSILTARTTLTATLSSLQAANQSYTATKTSVSPYGISLQQAAVDSAQAQITAINTQIAEGSIRSPIDGVITEEDIKVGETAADNTAVIHVISQGNFQINTYVSEADISKIQVGQKASVALSAQNQSTSTMPFSARVVSIDPAETMINGVGSYKVTLQFDELDPSIKPGMTAHADFSIQEKQNVLAVPSSAIITKDTANYVLVKNNSGVYVEQQVTIGIEDPQGYVEITSGLHEGDMVASFNNQ